MTNATYQSVRVTKADFKVAIAFEKTVHILYGETAVNGVATGLVEWREIEPHEVRETKDGNFVVVAMCRTRKELRSFRLDRISHYKMGTRGFVLSLPKTVDPNEITDWWRFTSKTDVEIVQLEIVIPSHTPYEELYAYVLNTAKTRSAKIRAVIKAEGGVAMRRLRRREVLALR